MSRNRNSCAWWVLCCFFSGAALAGDKMYVQSVKADLHQDPKLDSATVLSLSRGSEIEVETKQGLWVKVSASGKSGWVSRLFLSATHPVGEAELNKDMGGANLEKASRRRSSSYAVSASSRGLMTDERTRQGRALYRTDFDALDTLEQANLPPEKVKNFRAEAKLGE